MTKNLLAKGDPSLGFDTGLDTQAAGLSSDRRERIETYSTQVATQPKAQDDR